MEFLQPRSLPDALAIVAERPDAVPIAGGTDVMVELNFDRRRPEAILDLTRAPELAAGATRAGGAGSAPRGPPPRRPAPPPAPGGGGAGGAGPRGRAPPAGSRSTSSS